MSSNNNKQPLDLTESLPVFYKAQAPSTTRVQSAEASTTTPTINKLDYVEISLDVPEINQPDVTTRNLSHSDKLTIGSLLDCAKRGENLGNQRPPSICKVSRILRDLSECSFRPQLVSIGPIHREDPKLQEFERQKERYLNDLLNRSDSTPKETLEAFLLKVNHLIPEIRESYADVKKNYSDDELARMMVMDGCFILEFCFKHEEENLYLPNKMQNTRIAMDLMLLENQVPFFVLKDLFDCSMGKRSFTLSDVLDNYLAPYIKVFRLLLPEKNSNHRYVDSDSTHDHVLGYLHKRYRLVAAKSSKPKHAEASKLADEEQVARLSNPIHADKDGTRVGPGGSQDTHGILWCCVNFCKKIRLFLNAPGRKQLCSSFSTSFRKCPGSNCVLAPSQNAEASKPVDEELAAKSSNPTDAVEDEERIEDTAFHSVVELARSMMNFKPHLQQSLSLSLSGTPTLLMPTLVIDNTTELIFRNFIAYEQLFPQDHYCFTSYAHAMDMLIDTQEDIAKLVESKVLVNMLGSNQEAADMINKICKNISITDFCYTQEFKQMDKYYNGYLPTLRRRYFYNPDNSLQYILLYLSIMQTIYTTIQTMYTIRAARTDRSIQ